ncbi:MAG: alpha-glucan family phosphorylase [Cytophagaceae bacterium]|nr:alpha-glucan family phosphorylase [Cytophagaceae bacterium]
MTHHSPNTFQFQQEPKSGKKVAYFCMEYAIDQALKLYSGGLGFLAGSHLRSAYELNQNLIGVGILWKYGYYDQGREQEGLMKADFIKKQYSFLQDTGIVFPVSIHNSPVYIKAYYLPPHVFNSAPLFLLSTDIPENDYLSRTITFKLYDSNEAAKIAQSIVLGKAGAKLLDIIGYNAEIYHMNEGHALPLVFHLYSKYKNVDAVKSKVVFTTHTPEAAGNEKHDIKLLNEMGFFDGIPMEEVEQIAKIGEDGVVDYTLTALRFAKLANAVSKIHENTSNEMWKENEGICRITSVTNAQNKNYWMDRELREALEKHNDEWLSWKKKELKKQLFEVVADQTGNLFDPEVLTIVWARRFAGYKRPDLILRNYDRFVNLVTRTDKPVQMIWAGKPYPEDYLGISIFNSIIEKTARLKNCAVLTGHELKLSSILKKGADVWLNNPRFPREASGTSGMTAAMNGAVNLSIADGWYPEFARHGQNGFMINVEHAETDEQQDKVDENNLWNVLENEVVPTYYYDKRRWLDIMKAGMWEVTPQFDSGRMAQEYYDKIYNAD